MSEAIEQSIIRRSPLDEMHRNLGAMLAERDGWIIPVSYGDSSSEYAAVRDGAAGLIDLSSRARIEVSGAEAVQFLNGLVTNDVKSLEEGAWISAAFPNVQGRLLANTRVLRRGDKFLFDTEAATHERVLKTLERFTLAGDFHVADTTAQTALLSVQGARAGEIVGAILGDEAARVEHARLAVVTWRDSRITVIHATHTAEDGFDLFTDATAAPELWEALTSAGARPVGFEALETLRIEAGLPRYGVDMSDTNVVLEAALDDAVSYTKGCYIGQEIIARIHWRGHVAKRLAGLSFDNADDKAAPPHDSKIRAIDSKEIGRVTSSTFSPRLKRVVALGYVRYDYLAPGTEVRVVTEGGERTAHVAEVPMVRGSWYDGAARNEGANQ